MASWLGLVLEGSVNILVRGETVARKSQGSMFGEMSLFTGGTRSADVISGESDVGCTIGVIRFDTLDTIASEQPHLLHTLMMAMGSAAVHNAARLAAHHQRQESETSPHGRLSATVLQATGVARTRKLSAKRKSALEAAESEIIYRNKFTNLRKSEQRHKQQKEMVKKTKQRLEQKHKQERLTFQKKERMFVEAEQKLEEHLQNAINEKDSLLNDSTNKKIDEDAMNRKLRLTLEKKQKELNKLKTKLSNASLIYDRKEKKWLKRMNAKAIMQV